MHGGDGVHSGAPSPPSAPEVGVGRYAAGVVITVVAILSQYLVPENWAPAQAVYDNLPGDLFVVYGIPVIAFAVLVGAGPLRNWSHRMGLAAVEGLSWYGLLSLVALFVALFLAALYLIVDPSALQQLNRPNPALTQAAGNPWFWVGFSFVVGAFEETIFRGWIFGFWRNRTRSWIGPAILTSALFAAVHLYYGVTYGAAAPLIFPGLFLIGFAFAATYQASGGNLVIVAVLHGANDATAFYTLINLRQGIELHYGVILIGALVAAVYFLTRKGPMFPREWADPDRVQTPGERISSIQIPSGPS
jgi:membrane protease YdiL (CAAX protease family)